MSKIITPSNLVNFSKENKGKIVLVGGCFDVLHPGHIVFLQKAKKTGDILIVLLESDEKIKEIKGINRPVHNQKDRAFILSALKSVDYIVMLHSLKSDQSYEDIVVKIKPDIIAVTEGVSDFHHKRAAKLVGAKLKYVTKVVGNYSTSGILGR